MSGAAVESAIRLALKAKQARRAAQDALAAEPIAIIGMACRLPGGAATPALLWDLLCKGGDGVTRVPAERWEADQWYDPDLSAPGKMIARDGGFLDRIDEFDAAFFGIPDREAERMDPQQRLLLEVACEALDDAGLDHRTLAGTRSGLFIASYHNDYTLRQLTDLAGVDLRTGTGTLHSVLASRLAYLLDLRGPAMAIDTACSASLVAIHLACQSLRAGESDLALAGGVSLMAGPHTMVMMSKIGFMAPDGRSKTFDAAADGFGRGEGSGVLVLKRLSDALPARDRILAIVRGSAVNQDGRSTLLTAPNGPAQEELIRDGLAAAGLGPERIGFVETHGTGTALGDPIEVEAIAAVLGQTTDGKDPCLLGAIKANIGHLEAAAGVAGVIKAVLALRHRAIPPQPNFRSLNPHIRLDGTRLTIPTGLTPWAPPSTGGTRCAGVSAFGVSGTNAHVILEEAPALPSPAGAPEGAAWLLSLSAKTAAGLEDLARSWLAFVAGTDASLADLCHSAARRTQYEHRRAVVGQTREAIAAGLRRRVDTRTHHHAPPGLTFVFCGQGPQWFAMGRELLAAEPVFATAIEAVDTLLRPLAGWSVREELDRTEAASRLQQTDVAQPVLFAVQVALAALWRSWGVVPTVVVGHSVGEIAALHVAGALGLPDAVRVIFHRGRIMQRAEGLGRMAVVTLGEAEAKALIAPFGARLSLAAVNGPRSAVLSGELAALEQVLPAVPAHIMLPGRFAFHSAQMAPFQEELVTAIGQLRTHPCDVRIISTLTGKELSPTEIDAGYFGRNLREPVRFADAVASMPKGIAFLEIGPHPVLAQSIAETVGDASIVAASLRRGRPEREAMLQAAAVLYEARLLASPLRLQPAAASVVSLPCYPWQRRRYWLADPVAPHVRSRRDGHELIGPGITIAGTSTRVHVTGPEPIRNWLQQHQGPAGVWVPAAATMEAFVAAGAAALGAPVSLVEIAIDRPIAITDTTSLPWQIVARPMEGAAQIALEWFEAVPLAQGQWRPAAHATAHPASCAGPPAIVAGTQALDAAAVYRRMYELGAEFGPDFRLLANLAAGPGCASASVSLPAHLEPTGYTLHPVLLDAALQLCGLAAGPDQQGRTPGRLFVPVAIDSLDLRAPTGPARQDLLVRARVVSSHADMLRAEATILQQDGRWIAVLRGVRMKRLDGPLADALPLYGVGWVDAAPAPPRGKPPYLILADTGGVAAAVARDLPGPVLQVSQGVDFQRLGEWQWQINPSDPAHFRRVLAEAEWRGGTLVHCSSLDAMPGEAPLEDDVSGLGAMLHLAQAAQAGRMIVVTRGAQIVTGQEQVTGLTPRSAPLWGLAGVIRAEEPHLGLRMIDLDPGDATAPGLADELLAGAPASVAFRGGQRFSPMIHRHAPAIPQADSTRRLVVARPGSVDGLGWQTVTPVPPRAGELCARVCVAGLNFRDVLLTLGVYPDDATQLGAEFAGIVEAVGEGVPFTVGQRVFGCAPASLAGSVTVRADFLAAMPDDLSMTDASALPVAFLTAMYGLQDLARLQPGDSVLIHAGAGGVGMAAVQVAQRLGARVFATAGSPAKRDLLATMGVEQTMDSRTLDFADTLLRATGGRGVDVVLNSLAGDFIAAGLRCVAPGGRFLEIGKRGVWSPAQMAQARPDVSYFLYDLGAAAQADSGVMPPLYDDLLAALADGTLRPLPTTVYRLEEAASAMRSMAQARHVGKLVLRVAREPDREPRAIAPDGTYWITGGLSGLGLETADWLAGRGARHLLLTGRSKPGAATLTRIETLQATGVRVTVRQIDAADEAAMAAALAEIDPAHPLRGVIHAAGALNDGVLGRQVFADAAHAMRGKLAGAWVLHRLTRRLALDFFVLYSAAGVLLGASGQGLYPAANAGLDALAHYRRRLGLAGLSVAWGRWEGIGMAAKAAQQGEDAWLRRGARNIDPALGFAALERLLEQDAAYGLVLPIDWSRFLGTLPDGVDATMFARFSTAGVGNAQAASAPSPARTTVGGLLALPAGSRRPRLLAFLEETALAVAGLPRTQLLDPRVPLKEFGLDSLMAVELRNVLARAGDARLPPTLLFDYPTLDSLTDYLMAAWRLSAAATAMVSAEAQAIAAMSDEEAELMLAAELDSGEGGA